MKEIFNNFTIDFADYNWEDLSSIVLVCAKQHAGRTGFLNFLIFTPFTKYKVKNLILHLTKKTTSFFCIEFICFNIKN